MASPAPPCAGCISARLAAALIGLVGTVFHLSAGTTLAALAAGLSQRSEGGGSGFQTAIEALRLGVSLVSGWALASSLASLIGVVGVVWDYLPALRLFATQSVADSIVWALVISAVSVTIFHPSLSPRLAPMLCEEITSGELFASSPPLRPSSAFGLASLLTRRSSSDGSAALSGLSSSADAHRGQMAFSLLDVIGSFDQCVERIRPALAFGLVLSLFALVLRARLAAVVWSLYRQRAIQAAGYGELALGGAWLKGDEAGSAISDAGEETEDDEATVGALTPTTPRARSSAEPVKSSRWLQVPSPQQQHAAHKRA